MAAIQSGDTTGKIYDVDMTLHQSADGSGEGRITYRCAWASVFRSMPLPMSPHPDIPGLYCFEAEAGREPGDIAKITAIYRGVLIANPSIYTQYEYNLSATSEPIETHPLFSYPPDSPPVTTTQINEIQKALEQNRDPVGLSGASKTLYDKKRRGLESFMRVGAQFRKLYIQADPPTDYSGVGRIALPSNAPHLPSGQNFLFVGYSWRKAGGVCSITEDYQASGLGGWDKDLYT